MNKYIVVVKHYDSDDFCSVYLTTVVVADNKVAAREKLFATDPSLLEVVREARRTAVCYQEDTNMVEVYSVDDLSDGQVL